MDKIYRLLPWLDSKEALDFLHALTDTKVTNKHLIELCFAGHCAIYADFQHIHGQDRSTGEVLTGAGIGRITTTTSYYEHFTHKALYIDGKCNAISSVWVETVINDFVLLEDNECVFYFDDCEKSRPLLFKPTDIQALANKINGLSEIPTVNTVDTHALYQQIEEERTAREATEADLKTLQEQLDKAQAVADANYDARKETQAENEELRRRLGSQNLAEMRMMLMHDHEEFMAMQNRAEQAEKMVAHLDKRLSELTEIKRKGDEAFRKMTAYIRHEKSENHSELQLTPKLGISFPYSTKHLEAMREAALHFWAEHDRSKPAPYGIQKTVQNFLAERTGENTRKVAELANAIKPDHLPKA